MPRKRKPDEPKAVPESSTATAIAEPESTETQEPPEPPEPTFAERVGQTAVRNPDPFKIAGDFLAGVHLFESRQDRQVAIKFDEKPGQDVIDKVKTAGFRWDAVNRVWAHPVRSESAMTTRIEAESLYQEVRKMVRQTRGIESSPDIPF